MSNQSLYLTKRSSKKETTSPSMSEPIMEENVKYEIIVHDCGRKVILRRSPRLSEDPVYLRKHFEENYSRKNNPKII